jgi:hypothetical protein
MRGAVAYLATAEFGARLLAAVHLTMIDLACVSGLCAAIRGCGGASDTQEECQS